jgi:hypothetical protein
VQVALQEIERLQQRLETAAAESARAQDTILQLRALLRSSTSTHPPPKPLHATPLLADVESKRSPHVAAKLEQARNQVHELALQLQLVRAEYEQFRRSVELKQSQP